MPILTQSELGLHIGQQLLASLNLQPGEFEAAEHAAVLRAVQMAGITEPATAADADPWLKQPVAHLILASFVGRIRSAELIAWASDREKAAVAALKAKRGATTPQGGGSHVVAIGNIPTW